MNIRDIIYSINVVLLLLSATIFTVACNNDDERASFPAKEGMVPIEVVMPGGYTPFKSRADEHPFLEDGMVRYLPDSSTLRLLILNNIPTINGIKTADIAKECVYVVLSNVDGEPFLYPCEVYDGTEDDDGDGVPDHADGELKKHTITKEPYYLPKNTHFYSMALSPAKHLRELTPGGVKMVAVSNKEELLATNNNWAQTEYSNVTVPNDVTEKARVELNPLMYTTARIRVRIRNGKNITELDPGTPIMEFDRVGCDPGISWDGDAYNPGVNTAPDYNLVIGDSIDVQMGNNILNNRIHVDESYDTLWWEHLPAPKEMGREVGDSIWQKNIILTAETNILPIDARPTPVIIRLTVNVNLTPMQFHFQTRKRFLPGRTYDYTATINMDDNNIYVAAWQDASWSITVDPVK